VVFLIFVLAGAIVWLLKKKGDYDVALAESQPDGRGRDFEVRRLYFAAVVLTGLGLIFILGMCMQFFKGQNGPGDEIFDACVKTIPPIVTLVLGYYFGRSDAAEAAQNSAKRVVKSVKSGSDSN
jgi:hypothetical protein